MAVHHRPKHVSKAHKARKKSARGQQKSQAPQNFWTVPEAPESFGSERFRLILRQKDHADLSLDPNVEVIEWDDSSAELTGSVTLREPVGKPLKIGTDAVLSCMAAQVAGGPSTPVWELRVTEPSKDVQQGQTTLQVAADIAPLTKSKDDFSYRASKHKYPSGWPVNALIRDVCHRYGVRVGKLPVTKHRIKRLTATNAAPITVITRALAEENKERGTRFVVSMRFGRLDVETLRRPKYLLVMEKMLVNATIAESITDNFATVLTVRATRDKGTTSAKGKKHAKKTKQTVRFRVSSASGVAKYGIIHRNMDIKNASDKSARDLAKRELAKIAKPKKDTQFTHPGIVHVKRGDAIELVIRDENIRQLAYVASVQHHVAPGDYTMDVTMRLTDPYLDTKAERTAKKKAAAAAKRHRKTPSRTRGHHPPKTKRAKRQRAAA